MKILVIGSFGFIGSSLKLALSEKHEVYGADIFNDNSKNYTLVKNPESFVNHIKENKYDLVINCSGSASVQISFNSPFDDYNLNVNNVLLHLNSIKEYAPKTKYLLLSSAAVYGNPNVFPICENNFVAPISPYGYHKLAAENLCKEFNDIFNVQTLIVRIFSAYGPGLKKQLFWDLHQKCLISDKVELFGTGDETRDFIFIDDLVEAIKLLIINSSFENETYNIGSGYSTKIKDVAKVFFENLPKPIDYFFSNTALSGAPNNWSVNIERLKAFGFDPHYSINKGIKKTSLWLQENYPLE
jgi:dTDP-glucose 4,6-dehydratase/UDP-glucose 4-epimerase